MEVFGGGCVMCVCAVSDRKAKTTEWLKEYSLLQFI